MSLNEALDKAFGKKEEKKPIVATPKQATEIRVRVNKEKQFITKYYDDLIKALYNARNTIRFKKEVIAKDESKQYYRDFLKYEEIIEKLKELKK